MSSEKMRGKYITPNEIREAIFNEALTRLYMYYVYKDIDILDDAYQSLMFLGPPGVGKSALQRIAAKDLALYLTEVRSKILGEDYKVRVEKISMRISNTDAVKIAEEVIEGKVIPYVHLYLPQTKIWHLEGTPSPQDNYVEIKGIRMPVNLWRLDAYMIPLLDYTDKMDKDRVVPGILVLDEFNMARKEILDALFQLARSAELGRAKFSPFTIITLLGNTPETNVNVVRQLAAPLVDRAQNYYVSSPTVDGWLAYMNEVYKDKWAQEVGGFLSVNPKELYRQSLDDPTIVQTPRGWTQLATRMYVLKYMLGRNIIDREKFARQVERLAYSILISDTATEFLSFIRTLFHIKLEEVLNDPSKFKNMDRNVAAYMLVKVTQYIAKQYTWAASEDEKEKLKDKLVEIMRYAEQVLGKEAVSLVFSSLPIPMRLGLSKKLEPQMGKLAEETRKTAEELEELLVG